MAIFFSMLSILLSLCRFGLVTPAVIHSRAPVQSASCMKEPHGPFIFEYCTNSPVELRYLLNSGPNPDNRFAMAAWKNCQQRSPVETTPESIDCFYQGATKVSWTGSNCLHEFEYWGHAMHMVWSTRQAPGR